MTTKYSLLFTGLAISLITFFSCSKRGDKPANLNGDTLPGTWEIRGMWGPLIDTYPGAFRAGNGNTWSFTTSEFKQSTKDSVYNTGIYSVDNTGINPLTNKPAQRFIFKGIAAESFELRNDSLFVYSKQTDDWQSTSVYVKISYSY